MDRTGHRWTSAYEGHAVVYTVQRKEYFRDRRVVIVGGGDSAVDWAVALAERLETMEKARDIQRWMLDAPVRRLQIVMTSLTPCATGVSDPRVGTVCPPVVQYSREFQAHATEELALLPERSVITAMLSDNAVKRKEARGCH